MKALLFFSFLLTFLFGCSGKKEASDFANLAQDLAASNILKSTTDASDSFEKVEDLEQGASETSQTLATAAGQAAVSSNDESLTTTTTSEGFDFLTGECTNGYIESQNLISCGDFSNQIIENFDFTTGDYYGANFEGATITNSEIDIHKMAELEIVIDSGTLFDDPEKLVEYYQVQESLVERELDKITKYSSNIELASEELVELQNTLEESFEETVVVEIEKAMTNVEARIKNYEAELEKSIKRSERYTSQLGKTFNYLSAEKTINNAKANNKNWLRFTGGPALTIEPLTTLLSSFEEFSFSFWFRTVDLHKKAQLFNLNLGQKTTYFIVEVEDENVVFKLYRNGQSEKLSLKDKYHANDWKNVTIAVDSIGVDVYYDGKSVGRFELNSELVSVDETISTFGNSRDGKLPFWGDIDEIALWSKRLSEDDIKGLFNFGSPVKLQVDKNRDYVVKWWRMGDKGPSFMMGETHALEESED